MLLPRHLDHARSPDGVALDRFFADTTADGVDAGARVSIPSPYIATPWPGNHPMTRRHSHLS